MNHAEEFMRFADSAVTSYHSVICGKEMLKKEGFTELGLSDKWDIKEGGSYYIDVYGTTLVAFRVGKKNGRLHVASAHTDYPCLKVKPSPESTIENYARVNVIVYGGGIYDTWLDRPLGVAGKVVTKSDDIYKPNEIIIDSKRPVFTIPNLAIHMNRKVNDGVALNPQTELMPVAGLIGEELNKDGYFMKYIAKEAGVEPSDILDFDLTVYATDKACLTGINEELISASRIDNQTSVYSCLYGLISAGVPEEGINMITCFDNEEIGSRSKQGAASEILNYIVGKIYATLKDPNMDAAILKGFFLSLDVAHAIHPSHPEKCDATNHPLLGKGVVLKEDLNQKYATDVVYTSAFRQLCDKNNIPYQVFVNRNDVPGGSTLGAIISSYILMPTVDIGVPILAMHSIRELMAAADQESMDNVVKAFFS